MLVILSLAHNTYNQSLLAAFLEPLGCRLLGVQTYEALTTVLQQTSTIDLALIDISGFDRQVWHYCDRLKDRQIPFFVLTPRLDSKVNHLSLLHGANACLGKPLNRQSLIQLIQYHRSHLQ